MVRWAVLLTTHERVATTAACLDALERQVGHDVELVPYVVDAGSTDGTPELVERRYPHATVERLGPDRFWAGGMREAFGLAYADGCDAYLWLNDDTLLDPDAVARLRAAERDLAAAGSWPAILCGATRDGETGEVTYSGLERRSAWRPMSFVRVMPSSTPRRVDTMNGNCVLVPHEVASIVGNIDGRLTHAMGDIDYGLRAQRAGFDVWLAPGTVGVCDANPSRLVGPLREELRAFMGPKILPPGPWATMTLRWAGPLFPVAFVAPYVRQAVRSVLRS